MVIRTWSEFWGGMIDCLVCTFEELGDCRYCYTDFEEGYDIYEDEAGFNFAVPLQ